MIACQAPKFETVPDFLEMIMQQEIPIVIQLTRCNEKGRRKADPYWGYKEEGGKKVFGKYIVNTIDTLYDDVLEENYKEDIQIRYLQIMSDEGGYSFIQIHYMGWPDYGVPEDPHDVLDLVYMHLILGNTEKFASRNLVAVHCSADVGRTGVYCLVSRIVEMVTYQILEKETMYSSIRPITSSPKVREVEDKLEEMLIDHPTLTYEDCEALLPEFVLAMRSERAKMVQTKEQYEYLIESVATFFDECLNTIAEYYEPTDALTPLLKESHAQDFLDFIHRNQF